MLGRPVDVAYDESEYTNRDCRTNSNSRGERFPVCTACDQSRHSEPPGPCPVFSSFAYACRPDQLQGRNTGTHSRHKRSREEKL